MPDELDDLVFRENIFAWLRARLLTSPLLSRDDLCHFPFNGSSHRIVGTQTGIWRVKSMSPAAVSILTAYVPDGTQRPYEDQVGADGLLRYKYRGTNPNLADNVWLRTAMERHLPLVWFIGSGYRPGSKTQLFFPQFPVWLVAEEQDQHQFVVSVDEGQRLVPAGLDPEMAQIASKYNQRLVLSRHQQPVFRAAVLHAYQQRCSVCRLPFAELLDAAHIRPHAEGGSSRVGNGMALCKIHHGAFDSGIIGISPDYVVHVKESVLETFDGPTLQHSIKAMHGERLWQLPQHKHDQPNRDLLAERFEAFSSSS